MKYLINILVLLFATTNSFGQNIRELKANLPQATDSTKVGIYTSLGDAYQVINPDSAIYFYNMAVAFAQQAGQHQAWVDALRSSGNTQAKKGEDHKAAQQYRMSIKAADSLGLELADRGERVLELAWALKDNSPLEAMEWANEAFNLYENSDDDLKKIAIHSLRGQLYASGITPDKAIDEFAQAISLSRKVEDRKLIGTNLILSASTLTNLGNTSKALEYYYQAIDIGDRIQDAAMTADAKYKVAQIYYNQKKYQQAIDLFSDVLSYKARTDDLNSQIQLNYEIGLAHKGKSDPQTALLFFFKSYDLAKGVGDRLMMAKNFNERARSYLNLNRTSLTQKNVDWALGIAKADNLTEEMMKSNLILSDLRTKEKKYGAALTYYKRYTYYKEKYLLETKNAEINKIQAEFNNRQLELEQLHDEKRKYFEQQVRHMEQKGEKEVQAKNDEVFELNAKNDKLKNNTLIGSMILLLLFSLGTIIAYKNKLDDNKILINQKDEIIKQKEDLLRKNKRLIELNEEKDSLVNMVAHDLRSPLDQIKGLVSVINMNAKGNMKSQEYLDMISYAAERMRGLIGRTLNIRNIDNQNIDPKNEVFDVSKVVDDILNNFVELANRKNLTIHSELQRNGCYVKADVNYMIQILENLISNAIKFSPRGKNIRLKVGKYDRLVRIEVIDQGPGIRKEDMDRLFKKFQRLSARPTGDEDSTGLGLSIVKKFVDSMGGEVKCESTFGEGANFIVEFESHHPDEEA